jgi:hypothetical protein
MDPILAALLEHGLTPAAFVGVFIYLYVNKDKELKAERNARIEDAKETLKLVMAVQDKTSENINKLSTILDETRKQRGAA